MAEGKPGNGSDSPFGNGNGATASSGGSNGGHNFVRDPAGGGAKTGGRDFTKESRAQKSGTRSTSGCTRVPTPGTRSTVCTVSTVPAASPRTSSATNPADSAVTRS